MQLAALFAFMLFTGAAAAAPRTIDDCEAIQAPQAYNECLGSFGPTRGHGGGKVYAPARESTGGAGRSGGRRERSDAYLRKERGGRVRMEFTPGRL